MVTNTLVPYYSVTELKRVPDTKEKRTAAIGKQPKKALQAEPKSCRSIWLGWIDLFLTLCLSTDFPQHQYVLAHFGQLASLKSI